MENRIYLSLFVIAFVVIAGCIGDQSEEKPMTEIQDCGVSSSMASGKPLNEINYEEDSALVCLGSNMLNNCKKSKAVLETSNAGKVTFEVKGLVGSDCVVKMEYGDADQISLEAQKKYANKYIECPINIEQLTSRSEQDPTQKPGSFTGAVFIYLAFNSIDPNTKCTGTLLDVVQGFDTRNYSN